MLSSNLEVLQASLSKSSKLKHVGDLQAIRKGDRDRSEVGYLRILEYAAHSRTITVHNLGSYFVSLPVTQFTFSISGRIIAKTTSVAGRRMQHPGVTNTVKPLAPDMKNLVFNVFPGVLQGSWCTGNVFQIGAVQIGRTSEEKYISGFFGSQFVPGTANLASLRRVLNVKPMAPLKTVMEAWAKATADGVDLWQETPKTKKKQKYQGFLEDYVFTHVGVRGAMVEAIEEYATAE